MRLLFMKFIWKIFFLILICETATLSYAYRVSLKFNPNYSIRELISFYNADEKKLSVEISKSRHLLFLKSGNNILKEYKCVFGPNAWDDKMCEGDNCTPEGTFKILAKYPHQSWDKFMWIDYPNKDSWAKFSANKKAGLLSPNATIGGQIGIHGVPKNKSYLIDKSINWTAGCISLKNDDVEEVYEYIRQGATVYIHK